MDTQAVVQEFILKELVFGTRQKTLEPDEPLVSSGLLDSLALLRLISFLEQQFGIKIDDGDVAPENFQTLQVIQAFVERKQQAQGQSAVRSA